MENLNIITNNIPRALLDWCDLTESEQAEFDWVDENNAADFFRYKGHAYCLSEFMVTEIPGWEGIHGESYFSAVLIRFPNNGYDEIIVGHALS